MFGYRIIIVVLTAVIILPGGMAFDDVTENVPFDIVEFDDQDVSTPSTRQGVEVVNKFSDGSDFIVMNLTTPGAGGLYHNTTAAVRIPKSAVIQSAELTVEGLSTPIIDNIITTIDYADTGRTAAYAGLVFSDPPTGPLQDLKMMYEFNSLHRTNISAMDSLNVTNSSLGIDSRAFHMFQVNLSGEEFGAVNFTWVGHGETNTTPYQYSSKLFYWTGSEFQLMSLQSGGGGADQTAVAVLSDENILDTAGSMHIIALSPAETASGAGTLYTDYVQVQTLKNASGVSYPYNVSIDVGDTGVYDHVMAGELTAEAVVSQGLTAALQAAVDAAGTGYGDVFVPLRITSEHAGRLNISNIQVAYILDVKPELAAPIPNSTVILEDSGWTTSSISLSDYFTDAYGTENLSYRIVYKQDASEVDCRIAPVTNTLEFYTDKNFYGTSEFIVAARNRGDDNVANNSDDMTTNSDLFHVTVQPTNDPPVLFTLEFPDGHTRNVNQDLIKLITTGERAVEDRPFTFNITAVDIDGDTPVFSCNVSDGLGDDDIESFSLHPITGTVEFTPTGEHTGLLYFRISVTDYNGSEPLYDQVDIELLVDDVNDPPEVLTAGPLVAFEDRWNHFDLEAFDEEKSPLVFRSNVTDGEGTDERADFSINRNTGRISYFPVQADVGSFWINVSVEDTEGAVGYRDLQVVVRNVNDAPVITNVAGMAAVKGEYLLFEVNETDWLNLTLMYEDEDGDKLSFTAVPLPPSAGLPVGFDLDPAGGSIRFKAPVLTSGSRSNYYINISADDGSPVNNTDFVWIEIQINKKNRPPVVVSFDHTVSQGRVTFKLIASDPEGDVVRIVWDFGDGSSKLTSYGLGSRNHTYSGPGNYSVSVQVFDSRDEFTIYTKNINLTDDDFPALPVSDGGEDDGGASGALAGAVAAIMICIVIFAIIILFIIRRKKEEFRRSREEVKKLLDGSQPLDRKVVINMDEEEIDVESKRVGVEESGADDKRERVGKEEIEEGEKDEKQTTLSRFGSAFGPREEK